MDLFINAVVITLGILTAGFIAVVFYNVLHLILDGATAWTKNKQRELRNQEAAAYYQERRQRLEDEAARMILENAQLAELVAAIKNTPYMDAETKAARANNYQRAKLQKALRELVPNKGLRDVFYAA